MHKNTIDMFHEVLKRKSLASIASTIGLHTNTIDRWREHNHVPEHYVGDLRRMLGEEGVAVDQFYTKSSVAADCYGTFLKVAKELKIDLSKYHFIEPSAGCGYFFNALPEDRRTGVDIAPHGKAKDILEKADFLLWNPPVKKHYVVIGNPPFGLRGHLALQFINHAGEFADVVAFILPQLFESDGKGVPSKRVRPDMKLAYSAPLKADSFISPDGVSIPVSTVFQVWTKINHQHIKLKPRKTAKDFIKIYSLSNGGTPASTRNKHMIGNCDLYIPSTCFSGMKAYTKFEDLPNKRGYGIIIHQKKREIKKILRNHDWEKTAFPSTNSALNLRSSLIEDVITKHGYYDEQTAA